MKAEYLKHLSHVDKRTIVLHVFSWSVFILYELSFLYFFEELTSRSMVTFCLYYGVNVCLFYTQLWCLDLTFSRNGGYIKGIVRFLMAFVFFMVVKAVLDIVLAPSLPSIKAIVDTVRVYLYVNTFRSFYFVVLASFYWIAGNIAGYRKRVAISEKKQLIALREKAELETRCPKPGMLICSNSLIRIYYLMRSISFTVPFTRIPRRPHVASCCFPISCGITWRGPEVTEKRY